MANPVVAIRNFFAKHGSPVAPYAGTFVKAANKYGISPLLLAAIAMKETEGGLTGTGRPGQFNLGGVGGVGHMRSYPNYQASIQDIAANLGSPRYKGKPLPVETAMWVAGTPPTASTAPYTRDVAGFIRQLGGNPGRLNGLTPFSRPADAARASNSIVNSKLAGIGGGAGLGYLSSLVGSLSGVPELGQALKLLGGGHPEPGDRVIAKAGPQGLPVVASGKVTQTEQKAVNLIQQYLGRPYVYGGRTPKQGFDCSGLVQWVYGRLGVKLGNTTYDQIKQGHPVKYSQLRPGDIVFFYGPNPHHEGLYIGNGKFIHAPHTGDVIKISSLASGHYKDNFAAARRVA